MQQLEKIGNGHRKSIHRRYPGRLNKSNIDKNSYRVRLKQVKLFKETEEFLMDILDSVINTLNCRKNIMKDKGIIYDTCRV